MYTAVTFFRVNETEGECRQIHRSCNGCNGESVERAVVW